MEVYVKAERENTPNAQLKGLAKVELQPGETKQVKIHLPLAAFASAMRKARRSLRQAATAFMSVLPSLMPAA